MPALTKSIAEQLQQDQAATLKVLKQLKHLVRRLKGTVIDCLNLVAKEKPRHPVIGRQSN